MKIVLISLCVPTPYNCGAASALPYHLAKYRPEGVELEIYAFNTNRIAEPMRQEAEQALNARIHIIPLPAWHKWMFRLHLLFLRLFLKYPFQAYFDLPQGVEKKIKMSNPDAIWFYGEELSHIARRFPDKRCVVTGPDCEALYYYRELCHRGQFEGLFALLKNAIAYRKYARMVENYPTENVRYHLVGKEDYEFLRNLNLKAGATFIHHPHYDYLEKQIRFGQPKIRLLVAGRYDFYMHDKCDELFEAMVQAAVELKDHFVITFLGKDWEAWTTKLQTAGYETKHIAFAPDYQAELIRHDVQLSPIGVGTGTKGKVLDAFANGLMVMGTLRALENIAVKNGTECVLYDRPEEAIAVLRDMVGHVARYEQMAEAGRKAVLEHHGRQKVSARFFALFTANH